MAEPLPTPPERALQIRNRIRDNFDRSAAAYDQFEVGSAFFRDLARALAAFGPPLAGKRILDVGCGTGVSLEVLLEQAGPSGHVCGVDISLGMARRAAARCGRRAGLAVADGCAFAGVFRGAFDVVTYNAVLFMLPRWRDSLEATRSVLAEGGSVLVSYLRGVHLPSRELSVADLLAARGLRAGRHSLAAWTEVEDALENRFGGLGIQELQRDMPPEEFALFYGLEPMSAGLLPFLPYPERRTVVTELAAELKANGENVRQTWMLARAGGTGRT